MNVCTIVIVHSYNLITLHFSRILRDEILLAMSKVVIVGGGPVEYTGSEVTYGIQKSLPCLEIITSSSDDNSPVVDLGDELCDR